MFDDFDTQINCEEFYTQEFFCSVDEGTDCDGCGACFDNDTEDAGELKDAMESC